MVKSCLFSKYFNGNQRKLMIDERRLELDQKIDKC